MELTCLPILRIALIERLIIMVEKINFAIGRGKGDDNVCIVKYIDKVCVC